MCGGVILAGGRSTRFGEADKVVADLAGTPMVRRVADRLAGVVDEVVVNCRPDQTDAIESALAGFHGTVCFAEDAEIDRGPLAGIYTGLTALDAEYTAVVAADMPFVAPAFLTYLFDRAAGHDAAIPRRDGWFQTTQAVYRTAAMAEACARALARGDRRTTAPLSALEYVVVGEETVRTVATPETFTDLNTRAAFETAAADLEE